MRLRLLPLLCAVAVPSFAQTPAPPAAPAPAAKPPYGRIARLDFNRRAAERFLPLFWRDDANKNNVIEPAELAVLWGYGDGTRSHWVTDTGFTPQFENAYAALLKKEDFSKLPPAEQKRRQLVVDELTQGRPTLLESDFSNASAEDKAIVEHLTAAALLVEKIHARQLGVLGMEEPISPDDTVSKMMFYRNQGPFCVAPKTENVAECSALPTKPARVVGLYPAEIQADEKFCASLEKQKNGKQLMDHFSTVVAGKTAGTFAPQPYAKAWPEDMEAVAKELDAAAKAITGKDEAKFKAYLTAAAKAFRTNDWEGANAPWAAMGVDSKWYLRIAPDEVYYEPCAWKAGFATAFARINKDSVIWQQKLDPVKNDMEKALAALAGKPYAARNVKFKLPDFIELIVNTGDARDPHGGTIGQSLPNWGKVAEKGGRTVTMTNLYTDADSRASLADQMSSLFCKATNAKADTDTESALVGVVLHEAAHNLGPSHDYKVKGKEDDAIFTGPLAATLEELKAQTSALYFTDWLAERNVITKAQAEKIHVRDIAWAFGHISRGMYTANKQPKNYSQLASIQVGSFVKAGAMEWKATEKAANGKDTGCYEIHLEKLPAAVLELETQVLKIKASGDVDGAKKLIADYVDATDDWSKARELITERWLRAPKGSFVYSVKL